EIMAVKERVQKGRLPGLYLANDGDFCRPVVQPFAQRPKARTHLTADDLVDPIEGIAEKIQFLALVRCNLHVSSSLKKISRGTGTSGAAGRVTIHGPGLSGLRI